VAWASSQQLVELHDLIELGPLGSMARIAPKTAAGDWAPSNASTLHHKSLLG